jgi:hypothetical protein
MALTNFSIQQTIKPISPNKASEFDLICAEVEDVYLPKLLGVRMYSDLQANQANYTDLINGCTFVVDGIQYTHKGLNFILCYYNYAKYIKNSHLADTFTGLVNQNREETTQVSSAERERLAIENIEVASTNWLLTKFYLDNNTILYPLWNCADTKTILPFKMFAMPNNKKK